MMHSNIAKEDNNNKKEEEKRKKEKKYKMSGMHSDRVKGYG